MPGRDPVVCALCGTVAKLRHCAGHPTSRYAYVECRQCRCRGPLIEFSADPTGCPHMKAEREVVKGWNTLHAGDKVVMKKTEQEQG